MKVSRSTFNPFARKCAKLLSTTLLIGCAGIATTAQAHEPNAVSWNILEAETIGSYEPGANGADHKLLVELFPNHKEENDALLVVFDGCNNDTPVVDKPLKNLEEIILEPGAKPQVIDAEKLEPRWQVCPEKKNLLVQNHEELPLYVDFIRDENEGMSVQLGGKVFTVPNKLLDKTTNPDTLAKLLRDQHPAAELIINLMYRLDNRKGVWQFGDYETIFGSASEGPKVTRDYLKVADSMPVNLDSFLVKRLLPGDKQLPDFKQVLERVYEAGSGLGKDGDLRDEAQALQEAQASADDLLVLNKNNKLTAFSAYGVSKSGGQAYNLSGRFSSKWSTDHALHPGFGFWVEAWTNETGSWKKLAGDWVQWNGAWNLTVPASKNYQGDHLRVLYRSYNDYYRPQNQNGDTYSWRDPDRYNIGTSYDSGHRYADTDGGDYNGVGELVDAAMTLWSRLYWSANVNPVRSSPIELNFPNTWYDCGNGNGVPWSCATFAGDEIWLIATHGTSANVVAHELAHALHSKYWGGKMPANSGGSHNLSGCYPARLGMTLSEGFANFIPAWVGYPARNTASGGFGSGRWALSIDPEQSTGSPNCSNGWENETWVARTFWDLHDTRADVDDILWFTHLGGVINVFLGNGISNNGDARDMRDYENIYRNAASSGHEEFISDIFNQNRM